MVNEYFDDLENKCILHIDLDAFFAQIEILENPTLKNKPVVIGVDPDVNGNHGVVATANYVARKYGVKSAQSTREAKKLIPKAIFITPNHDKYKRISNDIKNIIKKYSSKIEMVSLDEGYVDISEFGTDSCKIAANIKNDIKTQLGLNASIGVSYNKTLAKLASEYGKPDALTIISPQEAEYFLRKLPIKEFRGVGKKALKMFESMGVVNGSDLLNVQKAVLKEKFGKLGEYFYYQVRGLDFNEVEYNKNHSSIGNEETFSKFLENYIDIEQEFKKIAINLSNRIKLAKKIPKTISIKIRDQNFKTMTKSYSFESGIDISPENILELAMSLFDEEYNAEGYSIRLLGISVSNFIDYHEIKKLDI